MQLLNRPFRKARSLRLLAISALSLYLLVNAFLILCLVHPHNTHLQAQADDHLGSVCTWVHKTVASHIPSSGVNLPLIAAALLVFVPLPQYAARLSPIRLTGRSPPQLLFV